MLKTMFVKSLTRGKAFYQFIYIYIYIYIYINNELQVIFNINQE